MSAPTGPQPHPAIILLLNSCLAQYQGDPPPHIRAAGDTLIKDRRYSEFFESLEKGDFETAAQKAASINLKNFEILKKGALASLANSIANPDEFTKGDTRSLRGRVSLIHAIMAFQNQNDVDFKDLQVDNLNKLRTIYDSVIKGK